MSFHHSLVYKKLLRVATAVLLVYQQITSVILILYRRYKRSYDTRFLQPDDTMVLENPTYKGIIGSNTCMHVIMGLYMYLCSVGFSNPLQVEADEEHIYAEPPDEGKLDESNH